MIDKKTREEIMKLLLKRKKRLHHKEFTVLCLHSDLDWIKSHMGMILDDLEMCGFFDNKKTEHGKEDTQTKEAKSL